MELTAKEKATELEACIRGEENICTNASLTSNDLVGLPALHCELKAVPQQTAVCVLFEYLSSFVIHALSILATAMLGSAPCPAHLPRWLHACKGP